MKFNNKDYKYINLGDLSAKQMKMLYLYENKELDKNKLETFEEELESINLEKGPGKIYNNLKKVCNNNLEELKIKINKIKNNKIYDEYITNALIDYLEYDEYYENL